MIEAILISILFCVRKNPGVIPLFTPKECGPIKKRVAPTDSSKNFGLGDMSPNFFYRYCKACKKRSFDRSGSKKLKNRCFLPLEDPILQAIQ